ncbi:MAG: EAL domain-containing protein [Thiogranum sp.]|nr:EAL domain-containing protein [Thiogranum sp.]
MLAAITSQFDEELAQARVRIGYTVLGSGFVLAVYLWSASLDPRHTPWLGVTIGAYALYAIGVLALIRHRPGNHPARRITSILADLTACSAMIYLLGAPGAALYPLYLWIIVGNGMRFGLRYLLIASVAGFAGFSLVISFSDYWLANRFTALGLLAGVVVLPLFFVVVDRRLHSSRLALQESEEKYRRLFEFSEDPMWLIVDNEFVMANPAASRILGYQSVAELFKTHPSLLSPEYQPDGRPSKEKADAMMAIAFRKGYHRFEWDHRTRDGVVFPVEVTLTKIPYAGGEALFCIWRDITGIRETQNALKEKTLYLDGILRSSEKVAIIATDPGGRIEYYNPAAEALLGVPVSEALGENLCELQRARGLDGARTAEAMTIAREQGGYRFTMDANFDGETRHIDARLSRVLSDGDQFAGYTLMLEDVTEQHRAAELIEYQASFDALTDLPNRRLFLTQLQQALARSRRHSHLSAVLFFDLDNFKSINDSLGHSTGDALLCQVAQRIKNALREEDTVARLGGDEFVVLLPEVSGDREEAVSDVQTLADAMREELAAPYRVGSHELRVTPSIGIAIFPYGNESPEDILRQADTAMYRAKASGRNAVRFFLPSMQKAAEQRLQTTNELRHALAAGELRVHFQPQFDAARRLCGAEALVRWQHPQRGLILPGEFIAVAEESGLVLEMGDWVLHAALARIRDWQTAMPGKPVGRVAVNVSSLQFRQADFVHKVERALGDTGTEPTCLTLEMTESILLEDFEGTVGKIKALKQLGVRFSIDDFGTGYSSLSYLKRLPVDEIKIDRAFVRDVMEDANDAALVDTMLTMARHLGLGAVAEGVESEAVFRFLGERGCPVFQGYYFGMPCAAEDFAQRFLAAPPALAVTAAPPSPR